MVATAARSLCFKIQEPISFQSSAFRWCVPAMEIGSCWGLYLSLKHNVPTPFPESPITLMPSSCPWTSSDIFFFFFNISVVDCPLFFASTKLPENLQWPFRAVPYWLTISSTSMTSETCSSLMVGKSMGQEWAYLCFKQRCVIFWVVTGLLLLRG